MEAMNLPRLRLAVELLLDRHGWVPGLAIIGLLVAALAAGIGVHQQREQIRIEQRRIELLSRQHEAVRTPAAAVPPVSPLQAFQSLLTREGDRIEFVRDIWDSAALEGIKLERAEYRSEPVNGGGFSRMSLRLPASGGYPAIKRYVFGLMARHPGLALERIDIRRERAEEDAVEVQLQFAFYMEPADER